MRPAPRPGPAAWTAAAFASALGLLCAIPLHAQEPDPVPMPGTPELPAPSPVPDPVGDPVPASSRAAPAGRGVDPEPDDPEPSRDTLDVFDMEEIVVTADRTPTRLATSAAAVTVLEGDRLRQLPVRSVADALRLVPGITFLDFDGMGGDPQAVVRGFYGGGETDYVQILIDGRPANLFGTGRIDWHLIPVSAIERIEVVRGAVSPLYGDAAIGGVVNVITEAHPGAGFEGGDPDSAGAPAGIGDTTGAEGGRKSARDGGGDRGANDGGAGANGRGGEPAGVGNGGGADGGSREAAESSTRWSLAGGEYGAREGSVAWDGTWSNRPASLFAHLEQGDGFRQHANRTSGSAGATVGLLEGGARELRLSALSHWRDRDDPGPLPAPTYAAAPQSAATIYRFDRRDEAVHRLSLDGWTPVGSDHVLSGYLAGEYRKSEQVRTIPLSPEFADTKKQVLTTLRALGSVQAEFHGLLPFAPGRVIVGADGSFGALDTRHYGILSGPPSVYRRTPLARGSLQASGSGARTTAAGFLHVEVRADPDVRISAGGRLDWIHDAVDPERVATGGDGVHASADGGAAARAGADGGATGGMAVEPPETTDATHVAFSPQVGINFRYVKGPDHEGHVYARVARSFKAPTPEQLFGQRTVPVPFPPGRVAFANAELDPQRGTTVEAGAYHRADLLGGLLAAEASLAGYRMAMRDEIDFDVSTLRYLNIGRSRHMGLEAGLRLYGPAWTTAFMSYTLQSVTVRGGALDGNRLKAIPGHFFTAGIGVGRPDGVSAHLLLHGVGEAWLDDENTRRLPGHTRTDVRLTYPIGDVRLSVEALNLFDREYAATGFLDPAGTGVAYYYPAAGRSLRIEVAIGG